MSFGRFAALKSGRLSKRSDLSDDEAEWRNANGRSRFKADGAAVPDGSGVDGAAVDGAVVGAAVVGAAVEGLVDLADGASISADLGGAVRADSRAADSVVSMIDAARAGSRSERTFALCVGSGVVADNPGLVAGIRRTVSGETRVEATPAGDRDGGGAGHIAINVT